MVVLIYDKTRFLLTSVFINDTYLCLCLDPDVSWLEDSVQDRVGLGSNPAEGPRYLLPDNVVIQVDQVHRTRYQPN